VIEQLPSMQMTMSSTSQYVKKKKKKSNDDFISNWCLITVSGTNAFHAINLALLQL
jgi:hypothetical protein